MGLCESKNKTNGQQNININSNGQVNTSSFSQFELEALESHNKYRRKHHAPPLTLNKELSSIAQKYASYLLSINSLIHSQNKYKGENIGENLFMCSGQTATGDMATTDWYDEIKQYDFNGDYQNGTGHFTQVVWKNTREVGFGVANEGKTYYVVANYYPAGNYIGEFSENVLRS